MPVPGTQVTLTLGVESTIPTPSGIVPSVGQSWSVEIENVSPWVLTVNVSGKPYNLAPGMGQLYVSTSGPASVTVIPSGSAASGSFYVLSNWAVAPDHIPGTFPVVVAPSLTGSIIANGPEFNLTNSPWAANNLNVSKTFTWPAGAGNVTGVAVTYYDSAGVNPSSPSHLIVSGATTGRVYLDLVVDHGQWILPVTQLLEPAGVTVVLDVPNAYAGPSSQTVSVVGLTSPQLIRSISGPGIEGPDTQTSNLASLGGSVVMVGTGSRTNVIRIWNLSLIAALSATGGTQRAYLRSGATDLWQISVGSASGNGPSCSISHDFKNGLPLQLFLNPLTLVTDPLIAATCNISYSTDCA